MKKLIPLAILMTFLVACSPSPEAIEKALEKTQAAMPTETVVHTPTPIPLSEIDLEAIMIMPNDLPAGYSGGQVREIATDQFIWVTNKGVNNITQEIVMDNDQAGRVTVFVYENMIDAQKAYQQLENSFGDDAKILVDVGDEAAYVVMDMDVVGLSIKNTSVAFTRCNASVDIAFFDTTDIMRVSAYAKRLDERLQPLVCR